MRRGTRSTLADNPFIVVIGFVASLISIYVFFSGNQTIFDFGQEEMVQDTPQGAATTHPPSTVETPESPTPSPENTLAPSPQTPTNTLPATSTVTLTLAPTVGEISFFVSVRNQKTGFPFLDLYVDRFYTATIQECQDAQCQWQQTGIYLPKGIHTVRVCGITADSNDDVYECGQELSITLSSSSTWTFRSINHLNVQD